LRCSENVALENPDNDPDLTWLRAYATAPPTVNVFGKVTMGYVLGGIPAITITLQGEKSLITSSADDHRHLSARPADGS